MITNSVRHKHIQHITLDNPQRHNALGYDDIQRLKAILAEFNEDSQQRVLVITGAGGKSFCAGAALDEMASGKMSGAIFETFTDALASTNKPSICALNGNAFGGGVEIAMCCDFRIGVKDLKIKVPAAELGLCYPYNGLQRYVNTFGLNFAKRLLLGAEALYSDELERVGWLHHRVEQAELDETTQIMADKLSGHAPLAMQAMKEILTEIAMQRSDAERALQLIEQCAQSEDLQEGLRASRERRRAEFTGR